MSTILTNITEANKRKPRRNQREIATMPQANFSDVLESDQTSSEELSWAATDSDVAGDGLPPDSSALQEQLLTEANRFENNKSVTITNTSGNKIVPTENESGAYRLNRSDEDSGLEMCLPGQMQTQAGSTSAKFDNGQDLTSHKSQDINEYDSRSYGASHIDALVDTRSYRRHPISPEGDSEWKAQSIDSLSIINSATIIPNTPSNPLSRPKPQKTRHLPDEREASRITHNEKSWADPPVTGILAGKKAIYKDDTKVSSSQSHSNFIVTTNHVKGISAVPEMHKRNRESNSDMALEHKKIKIQHPLNSSTQDSAAFVDSARLAHQAKRRFLNTLTEARVTNSHSNAALTSSNISLSPAEGSSKSSLDHPIIHQNGLETGPLRLKGSNQSSNGTGQTQNSTSYLHKLQAPNDSERMLVNRQSKISRSNMLSRTHSTATSQNDIKATGSAGTIITSPPTNNFVYVTFRDAYSDYTGDLKHFLGICRMINTSHQAGVAQHRSLWDDFVVKHVTDYGPYLISCHAASEDPIPYEQYYRDRVDEPCHNKRILIPESLREALETNYRTLSAASVGPDDFQIFNEFGEGSTKGYCSSSAQQNGTAKDLTSSFPARVQQPRESEHAFHSQDNINTIGTTHTLPGRSKIGNLPNARNGTTGSSLNGLIESRGNCDAHDGLTVNPQKSRYSLNGVSGYRTTPLPSSPLGNVSVMQGGEFDHLRQVPSSGGLQTHEQYRSSKSLSVPLHVKKNKNKRALFLSSLPLSSFSSMSSPPKLGMSFDTQTKCNSDENTKTGEDLASQNDTEYDRSRAIGISVSGSSGLKSAVAPNKSPATNLADSAKNHAKQVNEQNLKTNVSSMPLSSTTNQVLQQFYEAEQSRDCKKHFTEVEVAGKQEDSAMRPWWRTQNTVFKEFVSGYARLKNVDGALGTPILQKDDVLRKWSNRTKSSSDCKAEGTDASTNASNRQEEVGRKRKMHLDRGREGGPIRKKVELLSWRV